MRLSTFAAVLAITGITLVGCGRQVDVPPPDAEEDICASVVLPAVVAGAGSRPTTQPETAAWGEPPITYRCGVARPQALTATSRLIDVGEIGWLPLEASGGTGFVAVTWPSSAAPVYVEVLVPEDYAAPADVLIDVSAALATTG
ncbi:MAG: DUF3515 family protein [Candidatus Nanopelagicales bacterium]